MLLDSINNIDFMDATSFSSAESTETDNFHPEICILVKDDSSTCHSIATTTLKACKYEVVHYEKATQALEAIHKRKARLELVLTDVYLPEIDECFEKEVKLPVILMSANGYEKFELRDLECSTALYFMKPSISTNNVQNLWQHFVVTRSLNTTSVSTEATPVIHQVANKTEPTETSEQNIGPAEDDSTPQKKPKVFWTNELHQKFLEAIRHLGLDRASPTPLKILELMNVPGLTRQNVGSHLQKYRKSLKRVHVGKQSLNRVNEIFPKDNANKHCLSFAHSPSANVSNSIPQIKSQFLPIQPGFSGTISNTGGLGVTVGGIKMSSDGKYVGYGQGGLLHANELIISKPLSVAQNSSYDQANEETDFPQDEIMQLFLSSDFDNYLISNQANETSIQQQGDEVVINSGINTTSYEFNDWLQ